VTVTSAQQHTQNALLGFHCNSGYANVPPFYDILFAYPVYLLNDVKEITRYVEITSVCPSVRLCICINHGTVRWIFMKFSAGVLNEKLSNQREFRADHLSGSEALLRRLQEKFALFSIHFVRFGQNSVKKAFTKIYCVSARSLKISIAIGTRCFMGGGGGGG
jgi:hypothetical protein